MTWIDDRTARWMKSPNGGTLQKYLGMTTELFERVTSHPPKYILGLDEVGCGCLAGPLVVGAVLAPFDWSHPRLKDSKDTKTERERESILLALPSPGEVRYFVRRTPSQEVDRVGIRTARADAFTAVCETIAKMESSILIVIDGDVAARGFEQALIPKADTFVPHVMAASIVAKVSRDTEMKNLAKEYPGYGFENHKGYGTDEHNAALEKLGPCPLHRRSYRPIRKYFESSASVPNAG